MQVQKLVAREGVSSRQVGDFCFQKGLAVLWNEVERLRGDAFKCREQQRSVNWQAVQQRRDVERTSLERIEKVCDESTRNIGQTFRSHWNLKESDFIRLTQYRVTKMAGRTHTALMYLAAPTNRRARAAQHDGLRFVDIAERSQLFDDVVLYTGREWLGVDVLNF